jgi:uncharacterized protein YndB with AHSA1/START domain/uncharacterized glyoxalase superfamily protein PhnB
MRPNLNFAGIAENVLTHYQTALGGEFDILRFAGSPAEEFVPPEWGDKVLYGRLRTPFGEVDVMDAPPGRESEVGGNVAIAVDFDDEEHAGRVFEKLAEDGTVLMPFEETFFSRKFGMTTDKFGVRWMIGVRPAAVSLTHELEAPLARIWTAWTEPAAVSRWWGPHGFTITSFESDLRPGGVMRYEMQGPDGSVYPSSGTFEDVVPSQRIVTLAKITIGATVAFEARTAVTFEDRGAKTLVSVAQTFSKLTPQGEQAVAGAPEGWAQQFERLEAYLASERV